MNFKKCSVDGCNKPLKAKGYCNTHAERFRRNGTIELLNPPDTRPPVERIMDMIEMIPESGCWIWLGPGETHGHIRISGIPSPQSVHRIMWEHENGPIPDGMNVCHRCDIGFCCNPKHLFLGTQLDNMMDKVKKGRHARGEMIGNAKLNSIQVAEIRYSNEPRRLLAERYGVSQSTIKAVRGKQNWKHVGVTHQQS